MLDITIALTFAIRFGREYSAYRGNNVDNLSGGTRGVKYFENIYEVHDDEIMLDVLYSIAVG